MEIKMDIKCHNIQVIVKDIIRMVICKTISILDNTNRLVKIAVVIKMGKEDSKNKNL